LTKHTSLLQHGSTAGKFNCSGPKALIANISVPINIRLGRKLLTGIITLAYYILIALQKSPHHGSLSLKP
jgi:hypothetical protein